jgi:hypothetical protein
VEFDPRRRDHCRQVGALSALVLRPDVPRCMSTPHIDRSGRRGCSSSYVPHSTESDRASVRVRQRDRQTCTTPTSPSSSDADIDVVLASAGDRVDVRERVLAALCAGAPLVSLRCRTTIPEPRLRAATRSHAR